jgi:hypothetical protein
VKEVLSYLLAIAGFGVMASVFAAISGRRRYAEGRLWAIHMLRTSPNHAELVFRAQKGTFCEAVAAAMKTAAMTKSRDPNLLGMATKPAYDAHVTLVKMFWQKLVKRGRLGVGLSIGGIVLAFGVHTSPILHILLGIASLAAAGYTLAFKLDVDRSLLLARAELLPEVEQAFVDGRYGYLG